MEVINNQICIIDGNIEDNVCKDLMYDDIDYTKPVSLPFYSWHGCGGRCHCTIYADRVDWIDFYGKYITIYFNNISFNKHRHAEDDPFIDDNECQDCYKDYDHSKESEYESYEEYVHQKHEFNDYLSFKELMFYYEIQKIRTNILKN